MLPCRCGMSNHSSTPRRKSCIIAAASRLLVGESSSPSSLADFGVTFFNLICGFFGWNKFEEFLREREGESDAVMSSSTRSYYTTNFLWPLDIAYLFPRVAAAAHVHVSERLSPEHWSKMEKFQVRVLNQVFIAARRHPDERKQAETFESGFNCKVSGTSRREFFTFQRINHVQCCAMRERSS